MSVPVLRADVIEIRGIRGFGRHGVFEHERADGQEFVVDVRLELDTRPAAASDDLADTVNYGVVAEQVHRGDRERPGGPDRDPRPAHRRPVPRRPAGDSDRGDHPQALGTDHGAVRRRCPDRAAQSRRILVTETPSPHVIDADTLSGGLKPIRQVILSLGSNLGDREANLQGAVDALRDTPDVVVVEVSPVYETAAGRRPGRVRPVPEHRAARRHHAVGRHCCWTARTRSSRRSAGSAACRARRGPSTST